MTAVPPAVTVNAVAGGRVNACRSSENTSAIFPPDSETVALVSSGAAVSRATRKSPESPYRGLVKVTSVRRWRSLLMGPWPATGGVGPAEPHIGPAKRYRVAGLERLGAVVVAAGRGEVGLHGGVVRVAAGLVLVVGLVVPGPVVEILVLVGGLGAVEPVDGHALAGRGVRGGGVVTGVDGGGAADRREARAVGLDVGVAGRGAGLDEGVVVRDVAGHGVALGGGEEQQPELVARGHAGGDEAPVRGDLGGDGGQRAYDVHCQRVAVRVIDPVAPVVVAENVAEAPAGRHRILAIGGVGSQLGVGTRLPLKHQGVGRAGLKDRPLGGFQVPEI